MKKLISIISFILISTMIFVACNGEGNNSDIFIGESTLKDLTILNTVKNAGKGDIVAKMKTDMGDITIVLFKDVAPKAVENFVTHAKNGYYNGLTFHRVMDNFMIQGGDPLGNGTGGESIYDGKPFEDEFSEKAVNIRGALSMANSGSNTNGSQFFIVQAPKDVLNEDAFKLMEDDGLKFSDEVKKLYLENGGAPWLDNKHTVFGQVIDGMDVVDKIVKVEVDTADKPVKEVKIKSIDIIE